MGNWLIVYDRRAGRLARLDEYDDGQVALSARFALERENRDRPDMEIVVLGADSLDTIRCTHSRYFAGESAI